MCIGLDCQRIFSGHYHGIGTKTGDKTNHITVLVYPKQWEVELARTLGVLHVYMEDAEGHAFKGCVLWSTQSSSISDVLKHTMC